MCAKARTYCGMGLGAEWYISFEETIITRISGDTIHIYSRLHCRRFPHPSESVGGKPNSYLVSGISYFALTQLRAS